LPGIGLSCGLAGAVGGGACGGAFVSVVCPF